MAPMAETDTTRLGLHRWSAGTDTPSRSEFDTTFANIELYAARDEQGLDAAKPAPAIRGRWYFSTDTRKRLYRDDGTTLHELPLLAQPNDFRGNVTVATTTDGVTEATSSYAPLGVTRPASAGNRAYMALARNGGGRWAFGMDASDNLLVGVPTSSAVITTPLLTMGTTGVMRAIGPDHYFGANADASSGSRIHLGSLGDAANAYIIAEGTASSTGLYLRGQGTAAAVYVQPDATTTVATFTPTAVSITKATTITTGGLGVSAGGISVTGGATINGATSLTGTGTLAAAGAVTFATTLGVTGLSTLTGGFAAAAASSVAGKLTISAGGLDVSGSASGYTDELRFTTVIGTSAAHAVSTIDTGAPVLAFEHRGGSNTGSWVWDNGSGAASRRLTLGSGGILTTTDTIIVGGSGYVESVPNASQVNAVTAGRMGTGSDGTWFNVWDKIGARGFRFYDIVNSVTRWSVDGAGSASFAGRVNSTAIGTNNVSYADNDSHSWESDGAGGWRFANRWGIAGAIFRFYGGATFNEKARFADGTNFLGEADTWMGYGALRGSGGALKVATESSGAWAIISSRTAAGAFTDLYVDGVQQYFRDADGAVQLQITNVAGLSTSMTSLILTYKDGVGDVKNARIYSKTASQMSGGEHYLVAYLGN